MMKVSTLCFVFLGVLLGVQSQTDFTERRTVNGIPVGDCQAPDASGIAALIPESFALADGAPRPTVTVNDSAVVCQSPGLFRDTVGSFSVVVSYSCTDGPAECDGSLLTEQFQYDCNEDDTFTRPVVQFGLVRTQAPITGTLATPLNIQCAQCIDPANNIIGAGAADHCVGE